MLIGCVLESYKLAKVDGFAQATIVFAVNLENEAYQLFFENQGCDHKLVGPPYTCKQHVYSPAMPMMARNSKYAIHFWSTPIINDLELDERSLLMAGLSDMPTADMVKAIQFTNVSQKIVKGGGNSFIPTMRLEVLTDCDMVMNRWLFDNLQNIVWFMLDQPIMQKSKQTTLNDIQERDVTLGDLAGMETLSGDEIRENRDKASKELEENIDDGLGCDATVAID